MHMPKKKGKHEKLFSSKCYRNKITMKARMQEARKEIREEIEELIQLKPNDEAVLRCWGGRGIATENLRLYRRFL
jgi:hypothetical protein